MHKEEYFSRSHDELSKALAAVPNFPDAVFLDGKVLASLHQDDGAKAQFQQYLQMNPSDDPDHQRARRYLARPEPARARMAPPFTVTTLHGSRLSLDDLQGQVVLLDFWATWCGPCREALLHIRDIAKNEMTWPQYRDGGFNGSIAKMFVVSAIPHTFTIDAHGVLQDQHIGDASIEGQLKKLIAHARESQPQPAAKVN